jgi:hypothetical protein
MVSMRPARSVVMTASPMDASVTSMRSFPAVLRQQVRQLRAQVVLALLQLVHQRLHALRHVVEGEASMRPSSVPLTGRRTSWSPSWKRWVASARRRSMRLLAKMMIPAACR